MSVGIRIVEGRTTAAFEKGRDRRIEDKMGSSLVASGLPVPAGGSFALAFHTGDERKTAFWGLRMRGLRAS